MFLQPTQPVPVGEKGSTEFDQLKGTFLSSLNHEIRTPLSGIIGMTDLLLETSLDEEQREYVQAARMCAESLFHILNATLEYSALEAGTLKLDETEYSTKDLLDTVLSQQREKAEVKGLELTVLLDPTLPETVIGDASRIRDILTHLVDNAIKFTSAGSVAIEVKRQTGDMHRQVADGSQLLISVRDTGAGITAEHQKHIFESFRQGEGGLARGYSGLGLGLALVRKLILLMNGGITVESALGKGSNFTVRLPLRVPEVPAKDATAAGAGTTGPVILAVEDNVVGMLILRHALKGRPIMIDGAVDGPSAIAAARARKYDVILMDLQMPGMDGLEATKEIRKLPNYADVPIIALTADFSDEMRIECLRHGMQGFLSKPVEPGVLWASVARHLSLTV